MYVFVCQIILVEVVLLFLQFLTQSKSIYGVIFLLYEEGKMTWNWDFFVPFNLLGDQNKATTEALDLESIGLPFPGGN